MTPPATAVADLATLRAFLATTPLADASPRLAELFQLEHSMTIAKALEVRSAERRARVPEKKHTHQRAPFASRPPLSPFIHAPPPPPPPPHTHIHPLLHPLPLQSFQAKRILSAPLVVSPDLEDLVGDPDEGDGGAASTPQLLGWIDTSDILRAFLSHLDAHLAAEGKSLPTRMLELMTLLEKVGPGFAARPLVTVADGGDRALLYQAGPGHALLDVMRDQFLGGRGGAAPAPGAARLSPVVHRVAIFDGHGAITSIVSQLDVMRFLLRQRGGALPESLASASLADLGLLSGRPPVMTVDPHTPTLLALRSMLEAGVSGAAVVAPGGGGEMMANLSISDLRAVQPSHLSALALPVAEMLAVVHRTTYAGYSAGASKHSSHPFFQGRAGGGAGIASRGLRPPPGGSPTASVATTGTALTDATGAGGGGEVVDQDAAAPGPGGGAGVSRGPTSPTHGPGVGPGGVDEGDVRLIACHPGASLADLLGLFLTHGVHRVYVAADPDRPVPTAVVSPSDVMRLVVG